jgi:MFS family permease
MIHVIVLGTLYSQGIIYRALLADDSLGADRASGAVFGSSTVAVNLALGMVTGALTARYSHRSVALAGAALFSGGLLLASAAPTLTALVFAFALLVGPGASFAFQPAVVIIPLWFSSQRGLAQGIAVAGSGVGTLIMSQIIDSCVRAGGWRYALQVAGLLSAVLLSTSALFLVLPQKAAPAGAEAAAAAAAADDPEAASTRSRGALADCAPAGVASAPLVGAGGPPAPTAPLGRSGPPSAATTPSWRGIMRAPAIPTLMFVIAVYGMCLFCVYAHVVPAATDLGLDEAAGAGCVSAMGIAGAIGRLLVGAFSDRVANKALLLTLCLSTGGLAALAFGAATPSLLRARDADGRAGGASAAAATYVFSVVFGFFSGSIVAQMPPLLAAEVGLAQLSLAAGITYTVQAPFVFIGPPVAGALRTALNNYTGVWLMVGASMTLSPLLILRIPSARRV